VTDKKKPVWEPLGEAVIETHFTHRTDRLRVPGGWLYRDLWVDRANKVNRQPNLYTTLAFVPEERR
jgi:hypothetical protein